MTRRSADTKERRAIKSAGHGYVTRIDLEAIRRALRDAPRTTIVLRATIGRFVAVGDPVADVSGDHSEDIERVVLGSIRLEQQRDITCDAAWAIQQIETIAWTSISSSKSNPEPGLDGINAIRMLLASWSLEQDDIERSRDGAQGDIAYEDDPYGALFDALESFVVAASESLQHQCLTEAVLALAASYDVIPLSWRERADTMVMRLITTLGEHVLSVRLENALGELVAMLRSLHRPPQVRTALEQALEAMRQSLGRPGARGARINHTAA